MWAETPISVPENMKLTGENSKITYKQEQNLEKKFISHNLIRKLHEIHGELCKEWERLH